MQYPLDDRIIVLLAGPFLLALALLAKSGARTFLSARPWLFAGEASFALYMVHIPVLMVWRNAAEKLHGLPSNYRMSPWELALLLALSLAAAAFVMWPWSDPVGASFVGSRPTPPHASPRIGTFLSQRPRRPPLTYRSMIIAIAALAAPAMIAAPALAQTTAETQVVAVLDGYRGALEALSASRSEAFFWPDAQVFEQGGAEGSISQYLSHHLAPELEEFSSFAFQDHVTKATVVGDVAYATETYRFQIAFKTAGRARSNVAASPRAS